MSWDGLIERGDLFRYIHTQEYTSPTLKLANGDVFIVHSVSPHDKDLIFIMDNEDQATDARHLLPRMRRSILIKYCVFVRSYLDIKSREVFERFSGEGLSTEQKFWMLHNMRGTRTKIKPHGGSVAKK
jgi:hypothetical protein